MRRNTRATRGARWKLFAGHAPDYGPFAACYGLALRYHLHPALVVTIVGGPDDERAQALQRAALATYRPGRMLMFVSPDDAASYPAGKDDQPVAYICAGETCAEPIAEAEDIGSKSSAFGVQ